MKSKEVMVDGKKVEIIVELDSEYREENLMNEELEDTIDLSKIREKIVNLEDTMELNVNE